MLDKHSTEEKYLASAVHYLLSDDKSDTATDLMGCEIETWIDERNHRRIVLRGSRAFYETYSNDYEVDFHPDYGESVKDGRITASVLEAFRAVFPGYEVYIAYGVSLVDFDVDWRTRLLAEHDTKEQVSNQNPWIKEPIVWNGVRFSSPPEVEIAKALEKAGVTYLPNCLVRVGAPDNQQTLFPDFLVCYKGNWGILEVDGQTYHNGTATDDYERMRKLIHHVAHFDRYPAKRCMSEPDEVVKTFLNILGSK